MTVGADQQFDHVCAALVVLAVLRSPTPSYARPRLQQQRVEARPRTLLASHNH